MSNPVWSETERARFRRQQMAHREDDVLCVLPNGSKVYASALDVKIPERLKMIAAYAVIALVVVAFALLVSYAG